jgi:carbon storage regulator CsrA
MLVLTRHRDGKIFLDFNVVHIVLTVIEIGNGKVRLGFDAPREVSITRDDAHVLEPKMEAGR